MLLNGILTAVILLTCLHSFACEDLGDAIDNDGKWSLLTETSLLHPTPIRPIKFFDQNNGLAVQGGSIERTSDSGKSWHTVFYEEKKPIAAGIFISESEGWAVGTNNLAMPLILRTTDGGKRWIEVPFDEKSSDQLNGKIKVLWDICFDPEGAAWFTGDGGLLQMQVEKKHLRLLSIFPTSDASDRIACSESGDVWALGRENYIFRFRNGWVRKELDSRYYPTNIRSFGADVWIIGKDGAGNGILLLSLDSGESWQNKAPKSAGSLHDLILRDGAGWLVGAEGHIYNTTDNGETWRESKSPTNDDLLYLYSLDPNNVWISGRRETILKYKK